jgi:hypothetical protein
MGTFSGRLVAAPNALPDKTTSAETILPNIAVHLFCEVQITALLNCGNLNSLTLGVYRDCPKHQSPAGGYAGMTEDMFFFRRLTRLEQLKHLIDAANRCRFLLASASGATFSTAEFLLVDP